MHLLPPVLRKYEFDRAQVPLGSRKQKEYKLHETLKKKMEKKQPQVSQLLDYTYITAPALFHKTGRWILQGNDGFRDGFDSIWIAHYYSDRL